MQIIQGLLIAAALIAICFIAVCGIRAVCVWDSGRRNETAGRVDRQREQKGENRK